MNRANRGIRILMQFFSQVYDTLLDVRSGTSARARPLGIMRKSDNTRRQPIGAMDTQGCLDRS